MSFILREPQMGDFGWIVHRHGSLYGADHGYGPSFEALVAEIVADYIRRADLVKDRCWIAEVDGQKAGSVMILDQGERVAKLRLLLVEPFARGIGIGQALVQACIDFARQAGYRKIVLWTESELAAARGIYAKAGFRLVDQEPHTLFGSPQVGEVWELNL